MATMISSFSPAGTDTGELEFYEYSIVQRRLRAFGASIAGHRRFPMDIAPGAGGCWTDFSQRRVTIDPHFIEYRSAEEGMVLCKGYTAHEYAHVNYTTPLQNFRDTRPDVKTKILAHVINILDDERIERAQAESHWGTEKYLKYLRFRMYQQSSLLLGNDDPQDVLAAILQVRFGGMPKGVLSPLNADLFRRCWPHVETAWTAANTMEVAVEAEEIMKILSLDKIAAEQQKQLEELEKQLREILKGMACGSIIMGGPRSDNADQSPGKGATVTIIMPGAGAGEGQPGAGSGAGESQPGDGAGAGEGKPGAGSGAGEGQSADGSGKADADAANDKAGDKADGSDGASAGDSADGDETDAADGAAAGGKADAAGDKTDAGGDGIDGDKADSTDADGKAADGGDKTDSDADSKDADGAGDATNAAADKSGDQADAGAGDKADKNNPLNKTDTIIITIEQIEDILGQEADVLAKTLGKGPKPADKMGQRSEGAGGWQDVDCPLSPASAADIIQPATARAEILTRRLRQLPPRKRTQAVTFGPRYSMRDEWNRPDKPFRKRDVETKKRTVAISMLVDCSGSMGNLMPGVREAVLSTYLASIELGVPVEVRAFSSWQRNPAPVIVGFGENSNTAPEQIAGLAATGGTMLAAPLRIAGGELAKRREQHKVLLVLHDGEPGDKDESRMAILQLKRKINVIGVYLGQPSESANADLRDLFGRHLVVAETPEQLMTLLGAFIVKMVAPY